MNAVDKVASLFAEAGFEFEKEAKSIEKMSPERLQKYKAKLDSKFDKDVKMLSRSGAGRMGRTMAWSQLTGPMGAIAIDQGGQHMALKRNADRRDLGMPIAKPPNYDPHVLNRKAKHASVDDAIFQKVASAYDEAARAPVLTQSALQVVELYKEAGFWSAAAEHGGAAVKGIGEQIGKGVSALGAGIAKHAPTAAPHIENAGKWMAKNQGLTGSLALGAGAAGVAGAAGTAGLAGGAVAGRMTAR